MKMLTASHLLQKVTAKTANVFTSLIPWNNANSRTPTANNMSMATVQSANPTFTILTAYVIKTPKDAPFKLQLISARNVKTVTDLTTENASRTSLNLIGTRLIWTFSHQMTPKPRKLSSKHSQLENKTRSTLSLVLSQDMEDSSTLQTSKTASQFTLNQMEMDGNQNPNWMNTLEFRFPKRNSSMLLMSNVCQTTKWPHSPLSI